MDLSKIEAAVRQILEAVGENPDRPGLKDTPVRVARMYAEVFSGLHRDVSKDIKVFTEDGNDEMILIGDIPFYSMCEHHLLPFHGTANVVYIPKDGKILGLSKVARIVDTLSRKPQLQERLTSEIADTIIEAVDARSVCVVIEAEHLCMTMRGIRKPGSKTVTSAMRGGCRTDARTRNEALALINRQRIGG
ncbi:MAG TPA: GTP cyclohydrolase I FolE [Saccharofermentans sp.]|nr:GTP cyclohydrolase I FolE [Clostridia bacterium]NLX69241.1 GTP cyclohydrolase I FolE [Clostridiaceae bacterium]HOO48521.1 GTP cyclohydrolase I FolE [Saccharofermentans sp.]HPE27542.1 GTP cyclohydrolase I FolE [Saccharofermentans sp.]HPG64462.1 GTP cyclohydrolase I FolE [Saccharofermentans sp.]